MNSLDNDLIKSLNATPAGRGELFLKHEIWEAAHFQAVKFARPVDWGADPLNNRSWVFQLHRLAFFADLLAYDKEHGVSDGLELCLVILKDWWDKFQDPAHTPPMAWHDHGTALRALDVVAVRAALSKQREKDHALLGEILQAHALFLSKDTNYSKGTNHGLDQSITLYRLAAEAESAPWAEGLAHLAVDRIHHEIDTAFAPDGGHRENSVGYHQFGVSQLLKVRSLMAQYADLDLPRIDKLEALIETATVVLTQMLGPDGKMPQIGDTVVQRLPNLFANTDLPDAYHNYLYALTAGRSGQPPKRTSMILPHSGWISLRNHWKDKTAVHLMSRCGYASNYHRHDDDQTFVLKAHGQDWVVDGGLYQYTEQDPFRKYLRSYRAHSITAPTGEIPTRNLKDYDGGSRIDSWNEAPGRSYVSTSSRIFPGHVSRRSFTFDVDATTDVAELTLVDHVRPLDESAIKRRQRALDETGYCYTSRFMFPQDKTVDLSEANDKVLVRGTGMVMQLEILGQVHGIFLNKGVEGPEPDGWRSTTFATLEPAWALEIRHDTLDVAISYRISWQRG
ncbi:MAG: heparinase II/III family protein [Roseovarius sp.]|nr:heparinase II/III family protein [Roseovarius sp.]